MQSGESSTMRRKFSRFSFEAISALPPAVVAPRERGDAAELLAALLRGHLRLALAGYVDHDPEELGRLAVDAVDVDVVAQPDLAAVRGDHAVDELVVAPGKRLVMAEKGNVPILRMQTPHPEVGLLEPARDRIAEERLGGGVDVGEAEGFGGSRPGNGRPGIEETRLAVVLRRGRSVHELDLDFRRDAPMTINQYGVIPW